MAIKAPTYLTPGNYGSKYSKQIDSLVNGLTNRKEFTYDPMKDANFQQLAKVYNANGIKAAQDTLGQAAGLNGGYNTSWAVSAAQQSRNDYNQQLAALIPDLEQNAYQRYYDNFNMNLNTLGALQDADQNAYSRYRDSVADNQWLYGQNYQKYRDAVADSQWQKEFNLSKRQAARSRRRGGSGGGGYSGSYAGGGSGGGTGNLPKVPYSGPNDPSGQVGPGAVNPNHKATGKTSSYYAKGGSKKTSTSNKKKKPTVSFSGSR